MKKYENFCKALENLQDIYQYDDQEDYWTSGGRSVPENIPTLYEHFVDIKNVIALARVHQVAIFDCR